MLKIVIALLISSSVYAGGDTGPGDLAYPAINLIILFSLLIYKIKTPISNMFKDKSESIKGMIDSAAVKAKEAEMMMEMQSKKMAGSDEEIAKLESEANEIVSKFESEYKADVDTRISKMKEEAGNKIEAEKKELLDQLNASLLDQVLNKAKDKLKTDKGLSDSATAKILEGVK